ncbi:MAG: 30S ribosomal protein S12 methylthiotransferase RimO [Acidobacteriota bacterium]
MSKNRKIGFVSLGCPKNTVDSEVMIGHLGEAGAELTTRPEEADVIVVNTCGFIDAARRESIDAILEAVQHKTGGRCRRVVVAGCMVQRYGTELAREIPEVDAFVDLDSLASIATATGLAAGGASLGSGLPALPTHPGPVGHMNPGPRPATYIHDAATPRQRITPSWTAYIKIAEGCDNTCAFCAIPRFRGAFRSRPLADIEAEANRLAAEGVREINLIAQDSTAYGSDIGMTQGPATLLTALSGIDGIRWVRLFYVYPNKLTERLLEVMGEKETVARYVDIPLQHASRDVLARMRRGGSGETHLRLLERIRRAVPGVSIRTTFIVGFPGETDADHRQVLDLAREARFDHLGVFTYSHEDHTPAADLVDDVPGEVKDERQKELMKLQEGIADEIQKRRLGKTFPVLCEGACDETDHLLQGRLEGQAPDVDGRVLINDGHARPGTFVNVRITGTYPFDLIGRVVGPA